jgi:hypothetical protein
MGSARSRRGPAPTRVLQLAGLQRPLDEAAGERHVLQPRDRLARLPDFLQVPGLDGLLAQSRFDVPRRAHAHYLARAGRTLTSRGVPLITGGVERVSFREGAQARLASSSAHRA